MFKQILSLSLIFCFVGCKDNPYQNQIEKEQVQYAFNGIVELGAPISGAKITAHKFSDLKKGAKIADTVSNRDGSFELKFKTDYEGPLLLTASGGVYRDLATGQTTANKPEHELRSAITHIKMPERTNINAWTTLAVARVMADKGFWDKGVGKLKDRDRIDVDFNHVAQFLSGKSSKNINIRRQELLDPEANNLELESSTTMLHLAHGGLSQLAKIISNKLPPGYVITVSDLVLALSEDLSDRVFDGKNSDGLPVYLDASRNLNLSSQTMRKDFSESILLYGESLKFWNADYRLKLNDLVGPIAVHKSPEFFPEKEEPTPRDILPPKIFVSFNADRLSENPFALMKGEVFFKVKTTDETGVAEIRSISPRAEIIKSSQFGPFGIDYVQDPRTVATECGQEKEFSAEIEDRKLNDRNLVCACFEAKDVFGNAQRALSCFQRENISAAIELPHDAALVAKKDLLNGLSIKARVNSGVILTSCEWWISKDANLQPEENAALKGEGVIEKNGCVIDSNIAAENVSNGNYRLVIIAKDIFKRSLSVGKFGNQDNVVSFKVIKEPPPVHILFPKDGEYMSGKTIKMVGSFQDKDALDRISVSYRGQEESNKDIEGNFDVSLESVKNIWEAELGFNLPNGEYELGLIVLDIYGNERVMEPRRIILDESRPTIKSLNNPISVSYITGYRQIYAQSSGQLDRIEPSYSTRLNNGRIEFYRWTSEIYDDQKAPTFNFSIDDDNRLKEIKYEIDDKCSSLDNTKKLGQNDGVYEIKISPKFAKTSLLSSKELCLSIYAIDRAGNVESKNIMISWNVSVPPLSVHLNSTNFNKERMDLNESIWNKDGFNLLIKKGAEIGYAVITNQFSVPLETSLELEKPMNLKLEPLSWGFLDDEIAIPTQYIDVQYFKYNNKKDKVGSRLNYYRADKVLVEGATSIVAKFVIKDDFKFKSFVPQALGSSFWIDFPRVKSNFVAMKIKTADPRTGNESSHAAYYPESPSCQEGIIQSQTN